MGDWEGYGTCPVCHAAPDDPCLDTDDGHEKAKAHRTRGVLTDDPIYQRAIKDAMCLVEKQASLWQDDTLVRLGIGIALAAIKAGSSGDDHA